MTCNERGLLYTSGIWFSLICSVERWQRKCLCCIHCVLTPCHTILVMWQPKNCCWFVDMSYSCQQCENWEKLSCFGLLFRLKVPGHIMLAILFFSCVVCVPQIAGLRNVVEQHFLCHQTVAHFTYKWAFLDNKLFPLHIMQIETIFSQVK